MSSSQISEFFKAATATSVTRTREATKCLSEPRYSNFWREYVQRAFMRCKDTHPSCAEVRMILLRAVGDEPWGELVTARNWDTCLHRAAAAGHAKVVSALLKKINVERETAKKNGEGFTPLQVAIINGHLSVVEVLLPKMKHADLAGQDKSWTPLHVAIKSGSLRTVELLLPHLTDEELTYTTPRGDTALHIATINSRPTVLEHLMPRLSDEALWALGERGRPAFFDACVSRDDCLHLFFEYVKDYSLFNRRAHGRTYMHNIAYNDDSDLFDIISSYLCEEEVKTVMNIRSNKERDALFEAARRGSNDVLRRLLPLANVDAFLVLDHNEETLLHAAIDKELKDTVELILQYVPSHMIPDIVDGDGLRVRDAAEDHPEILSLFRSKTGAKNACS